MIKPLPFIDRARPKGVPMLTINKAGAIRLNRAAVEETGIQVGEHLRISTNGSIEKLFIQAGSFQGPAIRDTRYGVQANCVSYARALQVDKLVRYYYSPTPHVEPGTGPEESWTYHVFIKQLAS